MGIKKKKEMENCPLEGKLQSSRVIALKDICEIEDGLPVFRSLLQLIQTEGASEQLTLLKQVLAAIQKELCVSEIPSVQLELCLLIFTDIYFQSLTKNPLKKILASFLQNLPDQQKTMAKTALQNTLLEHFQIKNNSKIKISKRNIVESILACLDGFGLGEECLGEIWYEALSFLHDAMENFSTSALSSTNSVAVTERMHDCMASIKAIVAVLQKTKNHILVNFTASVSNLLSDIFCLASQILQNDAFLLDCRNACGMCLPLLLKTLNKPQSVKLFFQIFYPTNLSSCDVLDLSAILPTISKKQLISLSNLSCSGKICLILGTLAMFDSIELSEEFQAGHCLLTSVFGNQFKDIINSVSDSTTALATSYALVLWTQKVKLTLAAYPDKDFLKSHVWGDSTIGKEIFKYIWTNWEHFIDIVRQQTRIVFSNMVNIHLMATGEDPKKSEFLLNLTKSLLLLPGDQRGKYKCLSCLVEFLGAETMLKMHPILLSQIMSHMEDQSLVPQMCELVELLMTSYKNELIVTNSDCSLLSWQQTWIVPVVDTLCFGSTRQQVHIVEHLLPKLLKCCPETLQFVISSLIHKTDKDYYVTHLGALMTCLKTARTLGILKQSTESHDKTMWNNIIPVHILKQGLCHAAEQVRLNSFGLLCDSLKTTELIPSSDLELVRFFLPFNLNIQSPSFRQQMISLLKKLLIRLRDGGNMLLKQLSQLRKKELIESAELQQVQHHIDDYKSFLNWLSQLLFYSLLPESSFPRQTTVLSILATIDTIIGFNSDTGKRMGLSSCMTSPNLQSVLDCFTDGFEANKSIALSLLKRWPVDSVLFKDVKLIKALWNASLDLASSIKSQNCVTAAYLLRLLILRPTLFDIAKQTLQYLNQQVAETVPVVQANDQDQNRFEENDPQQYPDESLVQQNSESLDDFHTSEDNQIENTSYAVALVLHKILKMHMATAEKNIFLAAVTTPMFGLLHCIRYILEDLDFTILRHPLRWKCYFESLIISCFQIAKCTSSVVNNSSPEGHFPEDIEQKDLPDFCQLSLHEDDDDSDSSLMDEMGSESHRAFSSQIVLGCCWRSLKEVSLLLGFLTSCAPISQSSEKQGLLNCQQIFQIGYYFNRQLLESKHRGAFELAYTGFVLMCETLWKSSISVIHELPDKWLTDLIHDIQNCSEDSSLCATRRSAGLPFLIQALVSSELSADSHSSFKFVMMELLKMALPGTYSDTPSQVHTLNILRALYKDTKLGEEIYPYVADGVRAAILGFTAKSWAVRNSATLLFSALITRMFGVKRSRYDISKKNMMTGRTFFFRFPSLYTFLLDQLQEAAQHFNKLQLHPSLYPVLMILARLFPSLLEGCDTHLNTNAFVPYVISCGKSPVMKIRIMAARALVPLVAADQMICVLKQLLELFPQSESEAIDQNQVHGVLLQIQFLLQESNALPVSICNQIADTFLPVMGNFFWLAKRSNPCLITRAAFLDIIETVLAPTLHYPSQDCLMKQTFQLLLFDIGDLSSLSHHTPGATMFFATTVRFFFRLFIFNKELQKDLPDASKVILSLLKCHHYEVRLATLKQISSFLKSNSSRRELMDMDQSEDEVISAAYEDYIPYPDSDVLHNVLVKKVVIQLLVAMASGAEHMPECLTEVFNILSLILHKHSSQLMLENSCSSFDYLKLLQLTNEKRRIEKQTDLSCGLYRCSASLLLFVYEELSQDSGRKVSIKLALQEWCALHLLSISIEQSQQIRLVAAQSLVYNAVNLLLDPQQLIGDLSFLMWHSLIQSLQDEDVRIKEISARTILVLQESKHQNPIVGLLHPVQATYALQEALLLLVEEHGVKRWKDCVKTLFQWLLEEEPEIPHELQRKRTSVTKDSPVSESYVKAEKLRLFDKGEMNTYVEEVTYYRHIGNCLNRLLHGTVQEMLLNKYKPAKDEHRPSNTEYPLCDQNNLNASDNEKEWMGVIKELNLLDIAEKCLNKLEDLIKIYESFTYKIAFIEIQKVQRTVIQLYKYSAIFHCLQRLNLPFMDLQKVEERRMYLSKKMELCSRQGVVNAFTVKIQTLLKPKQQISS